MCQGMISLVIFTCRVMVNPILLIRKMVNGSEGREVI